MNPTTPDSTEDRETASLWVCSFPTEPTTNLVLEHKSYTATITVRCDESGENATVLLDWDAEDNERIVGEFDTVDEASDYAVEFSNEIEDDIHAELY